MRFEPIWLRGLLELWYPLRRMKRFLLALVSTVAIGMPSADVSEFSIFHQKDGRVEEKRFIYAELEPKFSFSAKSPHGILNPEGKEEVWSGQSVRTLFTLSGIKPAETNQEVVVVGTDGYLAQMEMRDFFNPDAMLATHASGAKIATNKGGPQLFFPNLDPALPEDLRFEGWGVWYVSAFIVGSLPHSVGLRTSKKNSKVVEFPKKGSSFRTTPKYYPPGHFRTTFDTKPVKMGIVPLDQFVRSHGIKEAKKLSVSTFYGRTVPIESNLQDYDLVVTWDGQAIPPKFGGPAHICPKGKVSHCTFMVRELLLE
jgi:hypothetical protein